MTREQRDALKRELLRQHPELAERDLGSRAGTVREARTPATSSHRTDPRSGRRAESHQPVSFLAPSQSMS